jgi:hypothetical protein
MDTDPGPLGTIHLSGWSSSGDARITEYPAAAGVDSRSVSSLVPSDFQTSSGTCAGEFTEILEMK